MGGRFGHSQAGREGEARPPSVMVRSAVKNKDTGIPKIHSKCKPDIKELARLQPWFWVLSRSSCRLLAGETGDVRTGTLMAFSLLFAFAAWGGGLCGFYAPGSVTV